MRIALVLLAVFLGATPLGAAPTCQDRNGGTTRCGAPGAMPLSWRLPPEEFHRRQLALQGAPNDKEIFTLIGALALFLAFLALLPEFDGSKDDDWKS